MKIHARTTALPASRVFLWASVWMLGLTVRVGAQGAGARPDNRAQAPSTRTARAAAAKDFTGYWESIVTEYWRYRMVVPDKSDYVVVPLNAEGRKVADAWDPGKDKAEGNECKGYGAAAIMQVPGRLHVYWQDDSTLRIDTDSGTQTRLLHFGGSAPQGEAPTWQGYSTASWEGNRPDSARVGGGGPIRDVRDTFIGGAQGAIGTGPREIGGAVPGYLRVVTTQMRSGYLLRNGVPYSANATVEEYFDHFSDPYSKETWLAVTTVVTDPQYLAEPLITHAHFKKLADNSGWDPTPCSVDQAR